MDQASHRPEFSLPVNISALQKRVGKDREFLCSEAIRNTVHDGKHGFLLKVRLTSYRSLPLSCIENIELKIDGKEVKQEQITFILNGYGHKVGELAKLSHNWWFILDTADVFVEWHEPLPAGEHLVDGLLVTVEPYVSGGRFTFFYPSQKRLSVSDEL